MLILRRPPSVGRLLGSGVVPRSFLRYLLLCTAPSLLPVCLPYLHKMFQSVVVVVAYPAHATDAHQFVQGRAGE